MSEFSQTNLWVIRVTPAHPLYKSFFLAKPADTSIHWQRVKCRDQSFHSSVLTGQSIFNISAYKKQICRRANEAYALVGSYYNSLLIVNFYILSQKFKGLYFSHLQVTKRF